jgi:hypothetical protein
LCQAHPDSSLDQALQRSVPVQGSTVVDPFSLSADGKVVYAAVYSRAFTGVAAISSSTWQILSREPFASQQDWPLGAGDGPWIVYEEFSSHYNESDFTVYAWNSVTGQLRRLGGSLSGPQGTWPSPFWNPAASGIYAAWAVGDGPGPVDKVILANLATGRETVVYQGVALQPFFEGDLLVWPQSARAGEVTTMRAVNVATGRPAALPAVLRGVHTYYNIAVSGNQTAYIVPPDYNQLYYSPSPSQPAHVVLRLPGSHQFSNVQTGPGWLAWETDVATYLASTRTGAYVKVTPEFGLIRGTGSTGVFVSDYVGKNDQHPPKHVFEFASIKWPGC